MTQVRVYSTGYSTLVRTRENSILCDFCSEWNCVLMEWSREGKPRGVGQVRWVTTVQVLHLGDLGNQVRGYHTGLYMDERLQYRSISKWGPIVQVYVWLRDNSTGLQENGGLQYRSMKPCFLNSRFSQSPCMWCCLVQYKLFTIFFEGFTSFWVTYKMSVCCSPCSRVTPSSGQAWSQGMHSCLDLGDQGKPVRGDSTGVRG